MTRKRNKYNVFVAEAGTCFYCNGKAKGILIYSNGDEAFCCKGCAVLHGKVKRFKKLKKFLVKPIKNDN